MRFIHLYIYLFFFFVFFVFFFGGGGGGGGAGESADVGGCSMDQCDPFIHGTEGLHPWYWCNHRIAPSWSAVGIQIMFSASRIYSREHRNVHPDCAFARCPSWSAHSDSEKDSSQRWSKRLPGRPAVNRDIYATGQQQDLKFTHEFCVYLSFYIGLTQETKLRNCGAP